MKLNFTIDNRSYQTDTRQGQSLAIPLQFNSHQPNHFGAVLASAKPMQGGDFIGDTRKGGSCNVNELTINPHCNGTHTESIHHITDAFFAPHRVMNSAMFPVTVITVAPVLAGFTNETYTPALADDDRVISADVLKEKLKNISAQALVGLVIRTKPNDDTKKTRQYGDACQPPFFTREAMLFLKEKNVQHLLVDFPSIDKMYDEGKLTNHHLFWQVAEGTHQYAAQSQTQKTVTEMIYVKDSITDGLYLMNLQIPAFESDAAPSNPVVYPLTSVTE